MGYFIDKAKMLQELEERFNVPSCFIENTKYIKKKLIDYIKMGYDDKNKK